MIAPALVYLFGLTAVRAQGAALTLMLAAAVPSVVIYASGGHSDWSAAGLAALGAIIGAVIGTKLVAGKNQKYQKTVSRVVSVGLLAVGIYIILAINGINDVPTAGINAAEGFLAGLAAGVVGGAAGIASGAVLIPLLTIPLGVHQKIAHFVALAAVIPASLPLVIAHITSGDVSRKTVVWLAVGSFLGACVGAAVAVKTPPALLATLFGVFLVLISTIALTKR